MHKQGGCGTNYASNLRNSFGNSGYFDNSSTVTETPHLNAQRTHATLGVWWHQHRETCRESVSSIGRYSRSNALQLRLCLFQ